MRRPPIVPSILLLGLLTGCMVPPAGMAPANLPAAAPSASPAAAIAPTATPAPQASVAASAAPSATPPAPSAQPPAPAAGLAGTATLRDAPFADAQVTAYAIGADVPLGSTTTDAQGRWALVPATPLAVGALVQVVVAKGDQRLSAVVEAAELSAAYALQATGARTEVTVASTVAVAAFYEALAAVEQARRAGGPSAPGKARAAFAAYVKLREAALPRIPASVTYDGYFLGLVDAKGVPVTRSRSSDATLRTFLDGLAAEVKAVGRELGLAVDTAPLEGSLGRGRRAGATGATGIGVTLVAPDDSDFVVEDGEAITVERAGDG